MLREDGRDNKDLRTCRMTRNINKYAEGSCLITLGETRVHCTASVDDWQPSFLRDTDQGWVTAEYSMLPRSTASRNRRERDVGVGGRTHEIQRLIGRSLRAAVDLRALGDRTITVDCDVIEADGGTRTAAINGGFVALVEALRVLGLERTALRSFIAAVSVGIKEGKVLLDIDYVEDSSAEVDMNVVMNSEGKYIEVQGTAEGAVFSGGDLERMLKSAGRGISQIIRAQKKALRWK